ncbi:hypothetical protein L210DRAFT_3551412 [Boletus edulis BED1]|uniref:Heterokaryon incompatibility domain-containing protein n=1 Tax=Boletus edulis BED1 TaxID=1328754 RepID=A0AAD4BNA6_BOLED|nr:hypothetical protein L210DRAFT_3551412 [Boletus edulis BED1]
MPAMTVGSIDCLAVSKDGRWIAAGTYFNDLFVWDATTYEQVWKHKDSNSIHAVDFSPDSTRLVSALEDTATIWDVTNRKQIQTLDHTRACVAKYSPQGDRIATATEESVRVWDSSDGRLLVKIPVGVTPWYNNGLVWFNDHLFVVSNNTIKQLDASTGSLVAEWPILDSNPYSCIVLPKYGQFIAYSTTDTVTFWCTSTRSQLAVVQHSQEIRTIAFSPDDRFLAIGGEGSKLSIQSLSRIIDSMPSSRLQPTFKEPDIQVDDAASNSPTPSSLLHLTSQEPDIQVDDTTSNSPTSSSPLRCTSLESDIRVDDAAIPLSRLHPTLQEPDIQIDDAALDAWKNDQLENADALLTLAISEAHSSSHHALANRAIVRARLQKWDAALKDAEMAIHVQPSIIALMAKSIAHVGNGEKDKGYRTCDIAFEPFHSSHVTFILLIKAIIVFMAGNHIDAISRLDDLIATVRFNSVCYTVQSYMYLLLGSSQMECGDYERAIHSFERARAQMPDEIGQPLFVVSLITGWKFDNLDIKIRQRLCETLLGVGRIKDAGESLLEIVNTLENKVYMSVPITKWVSDFAQQCLSTLENDGHATSNAPQQANPSMPHATVNLQAPTSLLGVWAKATLASSEWKDALAAAFVAPRFTIYEAVCERLETIGRIRDAIECFYAMTNELGEKSEPMTEWVCDFTQRRLFAHGDAASNTNRDSSISTTQTTLTPLLREWATAKLTRDSWKDVLLSATEFTLSGVEVYRALCERLETINRIADAVECFQEMTNELGEEPTELHEHHLAWALDFKQRALEKLEGLGDKAVDAERYDDAISPYSTALSLIPSSQAILLKRSKAWLATGSWKPALEDANQVITLDPSSPWGYEVKYATLHKGGDYDNAIDAFEVMLTKMAESPDPDVQQQSDRYISPSSTRALIRKVVQRTLQRSPRVLINTATGRLHDRAEQASAFEALPIFNELVSSTTTRIDYVRIKREVRQYFQYVMLSHKWEDNEPLFQQVVHIAVYDLETSPTHDKLQIFCNIVRDAGFNWAWSDTCCIDKSDHFVLQEALVAMFRWYQGSAMAIVFLRGVRPSSPCGALAGSIWNTRAWTLQEYIAAKVIRFYTEDWTLYRDLDVPNHKESPEIISEMEQATGVSTQQLKELRPGLSSIWDKLRLASTRSTTSVEDAAYSLLGIFSAIGIPAIYGEGEASLGRLLANVLTRSGDASILAWTGDSSRFNSCLPTRIAVFNGPATSHLPPPISDSEMEHIITGLRTPSFDLDTALRLYHRLNELPTPRFAESRMTLPCITFQLPPLSASRIGSTRVYHADTVVFGRVEIRTKHNLSRMNSLYLVHPWLDTLLQHGNHSSAIAEDDEEVFDEDTDDEESDDDLSSLYEAGSPSSPAPVQLIPVDRERGARRLVARLRQPFGALMFTLVSTGRRATDYKRVAADSLITVRFQDNVTLADILDNVRILDVL